MPDDRVKLAMALSVPIWAAMSVFVIVGAIYGGVSGLGVAFAAVFFATIFWFVAVAKVLGEEKETKTYSPASLDSRLSYIEGKLDELSKAKKE
jgi:hypothetical protein